MSESPTPGGATAPAPGAHGGARRSFGERLLGALWLDAGVYDEIEHDPSALPQAAGVVALGALAAGLGSPAAGGGVGLMAGLVAAALGWLASTAVVWLVGVYWLEHTSDYPELLRTLGFASAPQMLMLVGIIPLLGWLAALVSWAWGLAAFVVAVRQALDVTTGRAVAVCLLALGVWIALSLVLGLLFGLSL